VAGRLARPRLQPDLLGIGALVLAGWIATSDGLTDRNGKPVGTDFSNVYAAGQLNWQGRAAGAYQPALQHAASLLATPYVLDYDLVVLAVAITFYTHHGLVMPASCGAHPRDKENPVLVDAWIAQA
jgi:hypothetical protein